MGKLYSKLTFSYPNITGKWLNSKSKENSLGINLVARKKVNIFCERIYDSVFRFYGLKPILFIYLLSCTSAVIQSEWKDLQWDS